PVRLTDGTVLALPVSDGAAEQSTVEVSLRPERIQVLAAGTPASAGANVVRGKVSHVVYLGDSVHVRVETAAGELTAAVTSASPLVANVGDQVDLAFTPDAAIPVRS